MSISPLMERADTESLILRLRGTEIIHLIEIATFTTGVHGDDDRKHHRGEASLRVTEQLFDRDDRQGPPLLRRLPISFPREPKFQSHFSPVKTFEMRIAAAKRVRI